MAWCLPVSASVSNLGPRRKPKALYTVPTAGNPTGATLTAERRREVYQIAREHNILILEDDPYYFLSFSGAKLPSFWSLDTDGRVLRFDSFSKIFSSGMRVGFVSGPEALVQRIILHGQTSTLHPSGPSQAIIAKILEQWGLQGFDAHCRSVQAFYKGQCDSFLEACNTHLSGLAEWNPHISGGMFAWLKLLNIADSKALIAEHALQEKVLLVPGHVFFPPTAPPTPYVRASFSTAPAQQIQEALLRLRKLLLLAATHKK
eukprot:m.143443 g.143443  ORF g.143443 m.143443 type:complete len:260 (+) comp20433_c0_seq7:563-1342(+)